jgi:hypothetical protein
VVAYSFKERFIAPIEQGAKLQTIRAFGKRRHAQPGETLQLYYAMRTKQCRLIRTTKCEAVSGVTIRLTDSPQVVETAGSAWGGARTVINGASALDDFARSDGFTDWADMRAFWAKEHPGVDVFEGVLIRWSA